MPNWSKVYSNRSTGVRLGLLGIVPVAIGGFALYYTSIPLYLAFRKCDIFTTIILQYLWCGESPLNGILVSTLLIIVGSVIAILDDFDTNILGFLCVWGYNLAASF